MKNPNEFSLEVMVSEWRHFKDLPPTHAANQGSHPILRITGTFDPQKCVTKLVGGYQGVATTWTVTLRGQWTPLKALAHWFENHDDWSMT